LDPTASRASSFAFRVEGMNTSAAAPTASIDRH
jgi:hypothetical protein